MKRPDAAYLHRGQERIPLELALLEGDFGDGFEHWSASVHLELHDRVTLQGVLAGVVVHFQNGFLVRTGSPDGVALIRSEPTP